MRRYKWIGLVVLLLGSSAIGAQTKDGTIQTGVGVGVGLNPPARFDLDLNGEYFLNDTFSLGADFDILVGDKAGFNILGFSRYHFELLQAPRLEPYLGVGAGTLVKTDGKAWFDLMLPEIGFLYELTPLIQIGPNASFHTLFGSNTTWDLQLLGQIIFRF